MRRKKKEKSKERARKRTKKERKLARRPRYAWLVSVDESGNSCTQL